MRRLEESAAEGVIVARAPRELGLAKAELGLEVGQARVAAGDAQLERLGAAAVVVVVVAPPRTMPIAAAASAAVVPVGEQGGGAVDFLSNADADLRIVPGDGCSTDDDAWEEERRPPKNDGLWSCAAAGEVG